MAKIVTRAILGLFAWLCVFILSRLFSPEYSSLVMTIGFLAWVVFVVGLVWKNLSASRADHA
jgi:hypothetical protein